MVDLLFIVLAESALEPVPREILDHPSIVKDARRRCKRPEQLILDRSYHHHAMAGLSDAHRRGRPDIIHITLLTALSSPLNLTGNLKIYIHTRNDEVIFISPKVRVPRNSERFKGLIEQLYEFGQVPPKGEPLMKMRRMGIEELLRNIDPTLKVGMSMRGESRWIRDVVGLIANHDRPTVLVGGFPRGHFSKETISLLDKTFRIYSSGLESWTVTSWLIFAYMDVTGADKVVQNR
ncbi:MAG: 16S rRNA methyltransferase [Candidatus Bathyarchaeia archaeon]|nr:16S rRNA methyltransferase [Candidatus Bathyarchaeota archaeon]